MLVRINSNLYINTDQIVCIEASKRGVGYWVSLSNGEGVDLTQKELDFLCTKLGKRKAS